MSRLVPEIENSRWTNFVHRFYFVYKIISSYLGVWKNLAAVSIFHTWVWMGLGYIILTIILTEI